GRLRRAGRPGLRPAYRGQHRAAQPGDGRPARRTPVARLDAAWIHRMAAGGVQRRLRYPGQLHRYRGVGADDRRRPATFLGPGGYRTGILAGPQRTALVRLRRAVRRWPGCIAGGAALQRRVLSPALRRYGGSAGAEVAQPRGGPSHRQFELADRLDARFGDAVRRALRGDVLLLGQREDAPEVVVD